MDIKNEILSYLKSKFIKEKIDNEFKNMEVDVNGVAVEILRKIKHSIQNEWLSDFDVVEEIVSIFEMYNIDCGNRHDF